MKKQERIANERFDSRLEVRSVVGFVSLLCRRHDHRDGRPRGLEVSPWRRDVEADSPGDVGGAAGGLRLVKESSEGPGPQHRLPADGEAHEDRGGEAYEDEQKEQGQTQDVLVLVHRGGAAGAAGAHQGVQVDLGPRGWRGGGDLAVVAAHLGSTKNVERGRGRGRGGEKERGKWQREVRGREREKRISEGEDECEGESGEVEAGRGKGEKKREERKGWKDE